MQAQSSLDMPILPASYERCDVMHDEQEQSNKRSWVLVGAWFGTIVFLGVLKRVLEHQKSG